MKASKTLIVGIICLGGALALGALAFFGPFDQNVRTMLVLVAAVDMFLATAFIARAFMQKS